MRDTRDGTIGVKGGSQVLGIILWVGGVERLEGGIWRDKRRGILVGA